MPVLVQALYKTAKGEVIPDIAETDQRQKRISDSLDIKLPIFREIRCETKYERGEKKEKPYHYDDVRKNADR